MSNLTPFVGGQFYHVNNCGNNGKPVQGRERLWLFLHYLCSVAETYAYCLLGNHFYLPVKMKEDAVIYNQF